MDLECPAPVLRMYVGGIGGATEPELRAAFACAGVPLAHVELVVNRATGCFRGFAFVTVVNDPKSGSGRTTVDQVLASMRLALVGDCPVTVRPIARDLAPRPIHGPTASEQTAAESRRRRAGLVHRPGPRRVSISKRPV